MKDKENYKGQSKLGSLMEAKLNTFIGFPVAMLTWQYIVPIIYPDLAPYTGWGEALGITVLFTFVSVARNYCIRRCVNWWTHIRGDK